MICGWDETGPQIYYVDSDGQRLPGSVFSVGSGSTFAYGVLDTGYKYDLEFADAIELAQRAIFAATHRDAYSGGTVRVYHITVRRAHHQRRYMSHLALALALAHHNHHHRRRLYLGCERRKGALTALASLATAGEGLGADQGDGFDGALLPIHGQEALSHRHVAAPWRLAQQPPPACVGRPSVNDARPGNHTTALVCTVARSGCLPPRAAYQFFHTEAGVSRLRRLSVN